MSKLKSLKSSSDGIPQCHTSAPNDAHPFISLTLKPSHTLKTLITTLKQYLPSISHCRFYTMNQKWMVLERKMGEIFGRTASLRNSGDTASFIQKETVSLDLNGESFLFDFANQKLQSASHSFHSKKYISSLRHYQEVLRRYPGRHDGGYLRARVLCCLGMVCLKLMDAKKAVEYCVDSLHELATVEQVVTAAAEEHNSRLREEVQLMREKAVYRIRKSYLYLGTFNLMCVWEDSDFHHIKEEFPFLKVFEVIHANVGGQLNTSTGASLLASFQKPNGWNTNLHEYRDELEASNDIMISSLDEDLDIIPNEHLKMALKCWRQFARFSTTENNPQQRRHLTEWKNVVVLLFASCQLPLPMCTACGCSLTSREDTSRMVHGALREPKEIKLTSNMESLERDLWQIYDNIRTYVRHEETQSNNGQVEVAFPVCKNAACEQKIRSECTKPLKMDLLDQGDESIQQV